MISYVECLGGDGAGPGVTSRCWNTRPDEDLDELLPRNMAALQPKTEGSLRRRLLSARIHQHHDAILNASAAERPGTPTFDRKLLSPHLQPPGHSPWYLRQHLPSRPHVHPALAPEAHGKLFLAPEAHEKPLPSLPPLQRPVCPVLHQRYRTSSGPLTPEPRPGYTLPLSSSFRGPGPLREPEVPPQYRYKPSKRRRTGLFHLRVHRGRSPRREATQTTPLLGPGDGDKKWSVHYTSQKPQQSLVFIPEKRRSGSADDLQACNGLTQHGRPSSCQPRPPSPSSSGLDQSEGSSLRRRWRDKSRKMRSTFVDLLSESCFAVCFKCSVWRRKSSVFSDEDESFTVNNLRPMTPLILNPVCGPCSWDVLAPDYELTADMETEPSCRLPTPEEKMRAQAETVGAEIIPINVTGESFDRQASFRKTAGNTDSVSKTRNLSRRKTITGVPEGTGLRKAGPDSGVLPSQFSTVGRPGTASSSSSSSCSSAHRQKRQEEEEKESWELRQRKAQSLSRRIRAPRGEGMSSLMASLTSSPPGILRQDHSCSSSEFHSLPRLSTNSSLNSQSSCSSASYRQLSASSSHSTDLQGFPSDLQPLLPYDPTAGLIPQSPSSSSSSSFPLSSLPGSPKHMVRSECCQREGPLTPRPSSASSSSMAQSEFSYRALDGLTLAQQDSDGGSYGGEAWTDQTLSPSSSILSVRSRAEWTGRSCDPRLSSSLSVSSERLTSSPSLSSDRRRTSTSSTYSRSSTRSISLRKSKRPPAPPLRSDSLRRRPGRNKPPRSSCSPRLEHHPKQTPPTPPQSFLDPWVPRSVAKRRQSGLTCGTVSTFEPLVPDHHTAPPAEHPEQRPQSPCLPQSQDLLPGGSEEEALTLSLNPPSAAPPVAELQRLASPSSGYSSQSNTPTPGTPVASPVSPSSPLTAFSHTPTFPFSSVRPPSSPLCSLPRGRSQGEGRPKPPVPERKSSLFSSLSSSFSSTSSLSSCTSSDSFAKNPHLPAPPPPPPLPEFSSPLPPFFLSPHQDTPPPPPPPPPLLSQLSPPVFIELSPAPPLSVPPLPPPPPPPPLPPSFLPIPPPLPPPSPRPPPPPYSYAVRQSSRSLNSTPLPAPPPPPPLPMASPLSSPGLSKSPNRHGARTPPSPLVTAQALQGVKLRSVRNQEELAAVTMVTDTASANANSTNATQATSEAKLSEPGSHNGVCSLSEAEVTDPPEDADMDAPLAGLRPDLEYYDLMGRNATLPDCNPTNGKTPETPHRGRQQSESNSPESGPDGPWVRMSPQVDPQVSADRQDGVWQTGPSYWTLSGSKTVSPRGPRAPDPGLRNRDRILQTESPKKPRSPEKPLLPKKPDLCLLSLMAPPESRREACEPTRALCPGLNNQPQHPPGTPAPPPLTGQRSSSPHTLFPQTYKKPDPCLSPPKISRPLSAGEPSQTSRTSGDIMQTRTSLGYTGIYGNQDPPEPGSHRKTPHTQGPSETWSNSQTGPANMRTRLQQRKTRSPGEEDHVRGTKTMMSSTTRLRDKRTKRRKRRTGDEQDTRKDSTRQTGQREQVSSDSDSSCALIGRNKISLTGALSTDSLQGELQLPELLIQEPEEEETRGRPGEGEDTGKEDAALFLTVSADQMLISTRPRTTDDLFAVIHRSKRKMLGRRDLGDSGRLISSSRSPVAPPTDPLLQPKRPAALRGQRSSKSESFKALLLRKGSHSELSSRLSAVEQLRVVISSTTSADLRGVMSLPLPPPPPPPKDSDVSSHTCGLNTHLTPDTSLYSQNFSVTFSWSQKQFLLNSSSSPFFLLSSFSSSIRPRSHTPPCTSSRRSSARCRLYTAPMTAIFEEEREEEEEEEVFMEQSRRTVEM